MGRICRQTLSQAYEKTECRCCRRRVKAGGNAKDGYDIREALGRPVCLFVRTRHYSLANGQGNGYNNGMDSSGYCRLSDGRRRIIRCLRTATESLSGCPAGRTRPYCSPRLPHSGGFLPRDLSFPRSRSIRVRARDFTPFAEFCDRLGVKYVVEKTDIYEIVFNVRKEKNPCSLMCENAQGRARVRTEQRGLQ